MEKKGYVTSVLYVTIMLLVGTALFCDYLTVCRIGGYFIVAGIGISYAFILEIIAMVLMAIFFIKIGF